MKKKSALLLLGVFGIAAIFALTFYVNSSLALEDSSAAVAAVPATCLKTGINYAGRAGDFQKNNGVAKKYNMGYTMELATNPDQVNELASSMNNALDQGLTPIIRVCYANALDCGFKDPAIYISFLNKLSDLVKSRKFFALSGPNEPLSERWITGLERTTFPFSASDFDLIAKKNAEYMNAMTSGIKKTNIKLLSPAFNLTEPDFERFVSKMKTSGANFSKVVGIAGNAYNLKDYSVNGTKRETISAFVTRLKAVFPTNDIYLTEIGMFEISTNPNWTGTKVEPDQAKTNLASQIELLKKDTKVKAFLLFNSFGTNGDANFQYNVLNATDFSKVLSTACFSTPLCGGYAAPGTTHCNTTDCHQYLCDSNANWVDKGIGGACAAQPKCNGKITGKKCDGYAESGSTHCNTSLCRQFYCNNGVWEDRGWGGVCAGQANCSRIPQ